MSMGEMNGKFTSGTGGWAGLLRSIGPLQRFRKCCHSLLLTNMAEVRLKTFNGVYRLFVNSYKQSFLGTNVHQINGVIQAKSLLTESQSSETQNDRIINTPLLGNWTLPALGISDLKLGTRNSKCLSRFTEGGFGVRGCYNFTSKCDEGKIRFGSARRNMLSNRDYTCSLDADRCFYLSSPKPTDTQIYVIASGVSSWRRLVKATTQTSREHRRSLCTVRFANGFPQFHERLFVRTYGNVNMSEPLYKSRTAYYEILEVSPTATQSQIKTAYYKQSFIYHPDKNAGSEEATNRFSNISEAYNVLGNKGLRKKYDRGLLSQGDIIGAAKPSTKDTKTSQPTSEARQASTLGNDRKKIFDFDNFFKSHYRTQLLREEELRIRKEELMYKKESIKDQNLGKMMEMAVGVLIVIAVSLVMTLK